jgi:hypothetical protein
MSNTSGKNQKNDTLPQTRKSNGRWSFIQSDLTLDLSTALTTWKELEKAESTLSPDQKEFLKIKFMISQLKEKLEQF